MVNHVLDWKINNQNVSFFSNLMNKFSNFYFFLCYDNQIILGEKSNIGKYAFLYFKYKMRKESYKH